MIPMEHFWTNRYDNAQTGWDIGYPSTPVVAYFDQLTDKNQRILIPGAGNSYEAEYLFKKGFHNLHILDIANPPLENFARRVPDFPKEQIYHADFFSHEATYDIILEQTFFCALPPAMRADYARQMAGLLAPGGRLAGLWFSFPLRENQEEPPFGGSRAEYLSYFDDFFTVKHFEACYNSIPPRQGNEFFGLFIRE